MGTNDCGVLILNDQRGVWRPFGSHCDVGAYERASMLFLPIVMRE